jgi:hypothetical protein
MEQLTQQIETLAVTPPKMTAYWGVHIDPQLVFEHEHIKACLIVHPQLIKLPHIHSTLLYVGRKDNPNEAIYQPHEGKECTLIIQELGLSQEAMTLAVESLTFPTGEAVPTHATQQHITLALKKGIKAVDSVKALGEQGCRVRLTPEIILKGRIKRFLF